MNQRDDAELKAMEVALNALSGLQAEEQKRVLEWLSQKLKIRAVFLAKGAAERADIGISKIAGIQFPAGTTVEECERELILQTLAKTEQNKTRAAELLGISLKTLHNKLHEYNKSRRNSEC